MPVITGSLSDTHTGARIKTWKRPTAEQVRNLILNEEFVVLADPSPENDLFRSLPQAFKEAVADGTLFDMEYLPNRVIRDQAPRAMSLYLQGHIDHPFSVYALFHTWEEGGSVYLIDASDWHAVSSGRMPKETLYMVAEALCMEVDGRPKLFISDAAFVANGGTVLTGSLMRANQQDTRFSDQHAITNLSDPVLVAMLLLATEGIDIKIRPAPDKLNQQRIKAGKPPIPPHWCAKTGHYVTALSLKGKRIKDEAKGGGHASPIPHLRRGHIRHLTPSHEGKTIWVRDALVNVRDKEQITADMRRSFYQVKGLEKWQAVSTR